MKILQRYTMTGTHIGTVCIEEDHLGSWVKFTDVMEAQNTDVQHLKLKIAALANEIESYAQCGTGNIGCLIDKLRQLSSN